MQNKKIPNRIFQLVIFAVIPGIGVLFFNWDWREVVLLYWLENVTLGVVTLIKIMRAEVTVSPPTTPSESGVIKIGPQTPLAGKVFLAGFFAVHYGMFTFVHGIFVILMITTFGDPHAGGINLLGILPLWLIASVVTIVTSAIGPKPEETANALFFSPYKRVVPLHLTIIFGIGAINWLHLPGIAALMLIAIHVLVDILSIFEKKKQNIEIKSTDATMVE